MHDWTREDSGVTLTELLIVMGLFSFILSTVFLGAQAIQKSSVVAQSDGWIASNTAQPLLYLEQRIDQAVLISAYPTSNGTSIQFQSDPNLDGNNEQHNIVASGGKLTDTVYQLLNGARTGNPQVFTIINASNNPDYPTNANDSTHALFTYLGADSTTTVDPSNAKSIKANLRISFKGQYYTDSKQIFLHNLQK